MSRINTNVSSLISQTRLSRSQGQLQESLTRLSTGLRINSGKDDPAGLIASEALRSDITATSKAISNSEKANQVLSTADSALGQISSLLNDVRGLVTEAANTGVLSDDQVAANQLQIDSSLEAIDRISQVTTFQGRKLLDGSLDFLSNVTSGASSISDLNIQQANLGSAGSVNVSIDVTAAAQQALVTNTAVSYTPGVAAAGSLRFSDTAAIQAEGTLALTGGNLDISALAGGAADGVVGNGTDVVITNSTGIIQASGTVALTGGSILITAAADSAADGVVGNTTDVVFQDAANIVQATGNFTGATTAGTISLTAVAGGAADGTAGNVNVVLQSGGSTGVASFAAGVLTVNVAAGSDTFTNIAAAITADGRFTATATAGGGLSTVAGDLTTYNAVTTTGSNGTTSAAYNAGTNTITVDAAIGATLTQLAAAINGLAEFTSSATTGGAAVYDNSDNGTNTDALSTTAGANGVATSASYNATTNTITVAAAAQATFDDIADAISGINGGADFSALADTPAGIYAHGDNATFANALSGTTGVDATLSDIITITSDSTGTAFNGTLTFSTSNSVAAGLVDVQTSGANITVTVNDNSAYDLADLADSIQSQLTGYTVALSATAGDGTYTSSTDAAAKANLTGGTNDTGTGLAADVVFKLSGTQGAEVFNFSAGSGLADVVAAINLVKDATGVEATNNSGTLELRSTEYGSDAYVDVEVISEGTGGTFKSLLSTNRDTGTDIVASVNGTQAKGRGNAISLNTSSLDFDLTVAAGSSTDITFTISGGGALFQLGPDVVSNQQARIGISSVNSAKLGGNSGRLYELRSGNSADLATDITKAANIVDEAITKVTSLRGRLGAFQATTLDSNIASLNDTLANLTAAQSAIRDADFAAESAKLTRAQVLVQAGTAVLQIANQSPQSVLALLRG